MAISLVGHARAQDIGQLSPEQVAAWRLDLAYLAQQLPELHYDFYRNLSEDKFIQAADQLYEDIPGLEQHEVVVRLAQLVALAGDGHTALGMQQVGFKVFPVVAWWFADGPYIIQTTREYESLLGKRLTAVNGVPLDEAAVRIGTVFPWENESQLLKELPLSLWQAETLDALGLAQSPQSATFSVADGNGGTLTLELAAVQFSPQLDWLMAGPGIAGLTVPRGVNYRYLWNPDTAVLLLEYNVCLERQDLAFAEFEQIFLAALEQYDWQRVAIDLRNNGGGDSSILDPLISKLTALPAVNQPGRLYVLIGRATFSSAVLNAMSLRNQTTAILIGEPSGGKPNHFGEVAVFQLPNCGLSVQYSTKYFTPAADNPDSIYPDIEARQTYADYLSGYDPALALVREGAQPDRTASQPQ